MPPKNKEKVFYWRMPNGTFEKIGNLEAVELSEEDYEIDKKAWEALEEALGEDGLKLVPSERTRKNLLERKTNGNQER